MLRSAVALRPADARRASNVAPTAEQTPAVAFFETQSHKCVGQLPREAGIDLLPQPAVLAGIFSFIYLGPALNPTTEGFLEALKDEPVLGQPGD